MPELELAAAILDQRGAALDPVTRVAVKDTVELSDFRPMNMAADDAVELAAARRLCGRLLETVHVFHRIADPALQITCQRPVRVAEAASKGIDEAIGPERHVIEPGAQCGEPAAALHGAIEFVAVHDEQLLLAQRRVYV